MAKIADKQVRIETDAWEALSKFANENDIKISEAVSMFVRYCVEHAEVKAVEVTAEHLCIGQTILK